MTSLAVEVAALCARYGAPRLVDVTLPMSNVNFSAVQVRADRVAEVVFAIQRPNGRLITQTKATYPREVYRLPSGGIRQGETIEAALHREVAEETSLQAEVQRFLAIIHYTLTTARESRQFTSYAFLLRETGGLLCVADEQEHVTGFHEIRPDDLPDLAGALETLAGDPDPGADAWADWGRFRAVAHRVVAAQLAGDDRWHNAAGPRDLPANQKR